MRVRRGDLLPFSLAVAAHAAALAMLALLWEVEPGPAAFPAPERRSVVAPFVLSSPHRRPPIAPRTPLSSVNNDVLVPDGVDSTSMDPAPVAGADSMSGAPAVAGRGWTWQPTQPSSRFTEATLGSVVKDLPPRPNCVFMRLQRFQCLKLQSDWSLDSSIRVNLNCAGVMAARRRYAECVRHPVVALDSPPQGLDAAP